MESLKTSLALRTFSRTYFKVLGLGLAGHVRSLGLAGQVRGLGLEAYKSSKMFCPRPRTALLFELLKAGHGHDLFLLDLEEHEKPRGKFVKTFFFMFYFYFFQIAWIFAKNFGFVSDDLFFFNWTELALTSRDQSNFITSSCFFKFLQEELIQGFQQLFKEICFCICVVFLQPQPKNENKKFQKLYFSFSYITNYPNRLDASHPLVFIK